MNREVIRGSNICADQPGIYIVRSFTVKSHLACWCNGTVSDLRSRDRGFHFWSGRSIVFLCFVFHKG